MIEPSKKDNPNPAVTVDPPKPVRLLMSWVLNRMANPKRLAKAREAFEAKRQAKGAPHQVDYYHQLDDPYSHLSAQVVQVLAQNYDIKLVPHLIRATGGKAQPFPEKLATYARQDASLVAPHYGLHFPGNAGVLPNDQDTSLAVRMLANATADEFLERIAPVSEALWSGDRATLQSLAERFGTCNAAAAERSLDAGSAALAKAGHYSGGTFQYAGEWFWGVDRLYMLEKRLRARNTLRDANKPLIAPRPAIDHGAKQDTDHTLTLEIFPSLRSPYTAMIFDTACALADRSGINLVLRPVLPMVMRGVPATRAKGMYIFTDAAREAHELGVDYGKTYDPIGEPVRRAYSLYPWAASKGKGRELLSAFLSAAFAKGIATDNDRGMRKVVEAAGLPWKDAKQHLGKDGWQAEIEANQIAMMDGMGLWGVPSFRLSGPSSEPDLMVWGQDRLWLVAREIERRLAL